MQPPQASLTGSSESLRRVSRVERCLIVGVGMLVVGPTFVYCSRAEVAKWHLVAGFEQLLENNVDRAIPLVDEAIRWNPASQHLYERRAIWRMTTGSLEGVLADCEKALRIARVVHSQQPTSQRGNESLASTLNLTAYTRALAGEDLDRALAEINESLQIYPETSPGQLAPNILDTKGYIHYLRGEYRSGLATMLKAVGRLERDYRRDQSQLKRLRQQTVDPRPIDYLRELNERSLAVCYHHLGLVYEKLGRTDLAEKNLKRGKDHGYDPANGVW